MSFSSMINLLLVSISIFSVAKYICSKVLCCEFSTCNAKFRVTNRIHLPDCGKREIPERRAQAHAHDGKHCSQTLGSHGKFGPVGNANGTNKFINVRKAEMDNLSSYFWEVSLKGFMAEVF